MLVLDIGQGRAGEHGVEGLLGRVTAADGARTDARNEPGWNDDFQLQLLGQALERRGGLSGGHVHELPTLLRRSAERGFA